MNRPGGAFVVAPLSKRRALRYARKNLRFSPLSAQGHSDVLSLHQVSTLLRGRGCSVVRENYRVRSFALIVLGAMEILSIGACTSRGITITQATQGEYAIGSGAEQT